MKLVIRSGRTCPDAVAGRGGQSITTAAKRRHGPPLHLCLLLAIALTAGCSSHPGQLSTIKQRGTLIVVTRNAPTSYYVGRDNQPTGPEYELATAFARGIGVKPKFVVKNSVTAMLHALINGDGDMIAGGLTKTSDREQHFEFGPSYQQVRQQVVCRRGGPRPRKIAELANVDLQVVADSSYVSRLKQLKASHPQLQWRENVDAGTEQLLREVWNGKLDCTVADSDIVAINRRYFPNLVIAFNLSQPQSLAWVLPTGSDELHQAMQHWLRTWRKQGKLKRLMARYYAQAKVFDYVDTRAYVRKINSVYPRYQPMFHKAAQSYNLPPTILAAQAYQESHWNPKATSPTGVRGIMMLTRATAASLNVDNRLDAAASIRGGAKYLARMEGRLRGKIADDDRIWFALAAYNLGLAHIRDARKLTRQLGKNPNRWSDVVQVLPLLSKRHYYRDLAHGYARGMEPVRYIRRIRNYADILHHVQQRQSDPDTLLTSSSTSLASPD